MPANPAELDCRIAITSDVPAIIHLVKASWARTYDPVIGVEARKAKSDAKHVPSLFLSEIEREDAASIVAVKNEQIIGHVGGEMRGPTVFFVDHLHVDAAWQGKGVASALLNALRTVVCGDAAMNANCIELTVLENNFRALAFYRKHGFIPAKGANEDTGLGNVPSMLMRWNLCGDL